MTKLEKHPIIKNLMTLYQTFDIDLINNLEQIYAKNIVFIDPFHELTGLTDLTTYFSDMLSGLQECRFEFQEVMIDGDDKEPFKQYQAVFFWTMHYRHTRLNSGRPLSVSGNSHVKFFDKIFYHRDYFDAGQMLYEHIPVLGFGVRKIKQRMGS